MWCVNKKSGLLFGFCVCFDYLFDGINNVGISVVVVNVVVYEFVDFVMGLCFFFFNEGNIGVDLFRGVIVVLKSVVIDEGLL